MKLDRSYYMRDDVVSLARDLLGKVLVTCIHGKITSGIITETEAYAGITDKASHAYGGRRTERTEVMYFRGGTAYVYLCYGIHSLFNVVTNEEGIPHAVLVRGIYPEKGITLMQHRRNNRDLPFNKLTAGPGTVSQALGIQCRHTGTDLTGKMIWLEDSGLTLPSSKVAVGPRIGVDYAGDDALLPYRFKITGNLF